MKMITNNTSKYGPMIVSCGPHFLTLAQVHAATYKLDHDHFMRGRSSKFGLIEQGKALAGIDHDMYDAAKIGATRGYDADREESREWNSGDWKAINRRLKACHAAQEAIRPAKGKAPARGGESHVDCWNRPTNIQALHPDIAAILANDPDARDRDRRDGLVVNIYDLEAEEVDDNGIGDPRVLQEAAWRNGFDIAKYNRAQELKAAQRVASAIGFIIHDKAGRVKAAPKLGKRERIAAKLAALDAKRAARKA